VALFLLIGYIIYKQCFLQSTRSDVFEWNLFSMSIYVVLPSTLFVVIMIFITFTIEQYKKGYRIHDIGSVNPFLNSRDKGNGSINSFIGNYGNGTVVSHGINVELNLPTMPDDSGYPAGTIASYIGETARDSYMVWDMPNSIDNHTKKISAGDRR
jgi:hypothetical protein